MKCFEAIIVLIRQVLKHRNNSGCQGRGEEGKPITFIRLQAIPNRFYDAPLLINSYHLLLIPVILNSG